MGAVVETGAGVNGIATGHSSTRRGGCLGHRASSSPDIEINGNKVTVGNMGIGDEFGEPRGGRFDRATYEAASRKKLDAVPLLQTLETTRNLACGVASLLVLLKTHGVPEGGQSNDVLINHMQVDELLSLCIESMGLLNDRIEKLADHMTHRHDPDFGGD